MIKYDLTNINKWYNGSRNIVKCYHGTTNAFDLTGGGSPTPTGQTPCYAVTDDISQYQSTDFVDVYDTTADKWYKLNNLNQFEEYGIYGSGRTNTTYYEGKLTIDDGYEYIYSGNTWVNLGEVSGSSKTSDFTIDDIGNKVNTNVSDGDYVVISYYNHDNPREPRYMMSYKYSNGHNYANNFSGNTGSNTITTGTVIDNAVWILEATSTADTYYIKNVTTNEYWGYQTKASSQSFYTVNSSSKSPIRLVAYNNGVGFVEKASGANTFYGGYGLNQLYSYTYQLNWWNDGKSSESNFFASDGNALYTIYEVDNGGGSTYPEYYDEIADPPTSVTFTTMADALAYQCPYVGLRATIAGDRYIFNSNYEWEEVTSRLPQGYTELTYAQTPNKKTLGGSETFFVPIDLEPTYNYIFSFTPLSWEDSYYSPLVGGVDSSSTNKYSSYGIYKLDNGWGDMSRRFEGSFYNYNIGTRSAGALTGGWRVYTDVKATIKTHLVNYAKGNGVALTVENEGYETVNLTSTTINNSSYTVVDGIYNLQLFTGYGNNAKTPYLKFHELSVKTNNNQYIYQYVPAKRDSDDKVGLFDIINEQFDYPSTFNLTAGDPV